MKLGVGLMVVGTALIAFGLLFLTIGGPGCELEGCVRRPNIQEEAFWVGLVLFALGYARAAYTAWRSKHAGTRIFVVLVGVTFVAVMVRVFVPMWLPPVVDRNLSVLTRFGRGG